MGEVHRLLSPLAGDEEGEAFVQELLEALLSHDRAKKTDFINTLDTYLRCNCNLKEASAQLFIHYNTLRYRITKIEEILSMDLNASEVRLNLQIALRMLKMGEAHLK